MSRVMVPCRFPLGCTTNTADSSGLCSVHRRFRSGAGKWSPEKRVHLGNKTLPVVLENYGSQDVEWQACQDMSNKYMSELAEPMKHYDKQYHRNIYTVPGGNDGHVYWNGQDVQIPYEDDDVKIVYVPEYQSVAITSKSNNESFIDNNIAVMNRAEHDRLARQYNLSENGEQYGSALEAMAQLNIGRSSGHKVTYMKVNGNDAFRIKNSLGEQVGQGVLMRKVGFREDGTFGVVWMAVGGGVKNQEAATVTQEIQSLRTKMEKFDYIEPGAYYLPIGWVDSL